MPRDGSISYPDLSQKCGLGEDFLTRIVRYEITNFISTEPKPSHVAHTSLSLMMADNIPFAWLGHNSNECYLGITRTLEAFRKWPNSKKTNNTGFRIAYGTENSSF